MDRYDPWSTPHGRGLGTPPSLDPRLPGRAAPRRIPPRVDPRRRGRRRAWALEANVVEGARRGWWLTLGALAAALLLPLTARGQGLRSTTASITLQVTAPPHLRAGAKAPSPGASVRDVALAVPPVPFEVAALELALVSSGDGSAISDHRGAPGGEDARSTTTLYVRDARGALVGVSTEPIALSPEQALRGAIVLRAVAAGGDSLTGGPWQLRVRLTPREASGPPVEFVQVVGLGDTPRPRSEGDRR